MSDDNAPQPSSPLSLQRITAAFARMLGSPAPGPGSADTADAPPASDPCEINPRTIVEGVLFVGAQEGRALTAEELAAAMRGVSPEEVRSAVDELNDAYQRDAAPYEIVQQTSGYRLQLRPDMLRMRDKFYGRVKEAKLSPAAMEVLSVVAYKQPVTRERVDKLRGSGSGNLLAGLVRRGLVRLDRGAEPSTEARYTTTDRFLRLFGIQHAGQLPRAAEMED